ncbi:MAG: replication protein P [Pseudomonadales bacterium]|nr:replication protein P [Pseudomonadales bacterium]
MKKLKTLLANIPLDNTGLAAGTVSASREKARTASRAGGAEAGAGRDHVDVINQLFAEFELAYHNQYHKAYAQEGSLVLAKKYWLSCLGGFAPALILKAARQVVTHQEYLPSLSTIVQACENALDLFGLPEAHEAYVEACCAPAPKSGHAWSHPAVYLAGRASGWFELANQPEAVMYPRFEYHYRLLCRQVINGEELHLNIPEALSAHPPRPLSPEENRQRLEVLRKQMKFN